MRRDLRVVPPLYLGWPNFSEVSVLKYFSSGVVHIEVDLVTDQSQDTRRDANPEVPWQNGLDLGKGRNQVVALVLGEFPFLRSDTVHLSTQYKVLLFSLGGDLTSILGDG